MNPITLTMDSNEQGSNRAKALEMYAKGDDRFEWLGFSDCLADVMFALPCEGGACEDCEPPYDNCFYGKLNVELKEPADYIQSTLSKTGHLYLQSLTMREAQHLGIIVVLGGDDDISEAIMDSLKTRYHGQALGFQISNYTDRLYDFEAKSYALGCPVMRWKSSPWKRLLSHAHKVLSGCDLLDYRPRPEGERDVASLCVLVPNLGPVRAKAILEKYGGIGPLATAISYERIHGNDIKTLCKIPNIGKKTAEAISEAIK